MATRRIKFRNFKGKPSAEMVEQLQEDATVSLPEMRYRVRSGTTRCKNYEYKIAALLSLRAVFYQEDMWISSNPDGIGAFNDIIFHQGSKTFMLQLKHEDDPKPILEQEFLTQEGDFVLQKHIQDIRKLKSSIESKSKKPKIVNYLGRFDDIYFVLFTNRNVKGCEFLRQSCDKFPVLNTGTNVFEIDVAKVENLGDTNGFPKLYLLSGQVHNKDVDKEIAGEILKLVKRFELEQTDVKYVAEKFTEFITDWAVGSLGGHYCLKKRDVICKLTQLFCHRFTIELTREEFTFYASKKKHIWNKVVQDEICTVVEFDETVSKFLLEYIGSEVEKYCTQPFDRWSDCFSKQERKSFYQEHAGIKTHMLKTVGSGGKITLADVYKTLWMKRKLPLLLQIDKNEQCCDILHILKLSGYYYKAMVLNKSGEFVSFVNSEGTSNCFVTLKDLNQEKRNRILEQAVEFQGRSSAVLVELVDENMLQFITCRDVINILLEKFNIGNNLSPLPKHFISRRVSRIFLQSKILSEIQDEIFLIEEMPEKHFEILSAEHVNVHQMEDTNLTNFKDGGIIVSTKSITRPEIEALKSAKEPVHYLAFKSENYLEWKASSGSVKNLRRFQVEVDDCAEGSVTNKFCSLTNLVSAGPGAGKSVLLDYVALQAPVTKWVLKIDLSRHQKYLRNNAWKIQDASKHLAYFKKALCRYKGNTDLSNAIFEKLLKTKDVIVLFDGFDELSVAYKDDVTSFVVKSFCNGGYCVWLTTRPHTTAHLEEELNTFARTLKPFSVNDQRELLMSYFGANNVQLTSNSEKLIREFVDKLLIAARRNRTYWDEEFTGVPLQTKFLAEVFKGDCASYVSSKGVAGFEENFDLLYLYENFIDRSIDTLCDKFSPSAEDTHMVFKVHQALFAVQFLFQQHKNLVAYERIYRKLHDYYKDRPDKTRLLQKGVVVLDSDLEVSFKHRTYAEYLAARWLTENLSSSNQQVKEFIQILIIERFNQDYGFLFGFYDRMLSRNFPLHLSVMSNKIEETLRNISTHPDMINVVDKGKRSVLHVIALNGIRFPWSFNWCDQFQIDGQTVEFLKSETFNSDRLLDIAEKILNSDLLEIPADILGYTPLDYAVANQSLTLADKISAKCTTLTINVEPKFRNMYLVYCSVLGYESLFNVLLPYFASKDLLYTSKNRTELVSSYLDDVLRFSCLTYCTTLAEKKLIKCLESKIEKFSLKFKSQFRNKTLLQLLQPDRSINSEHGRFYTDIRYAVCFGSARNLESLLSEGVDVNKGDGDFNTPLHYAVLHNKRKKVEILLSKNADVNKQNTDKNTPLHLVFFNSSSSSASSETRKEKTVAQLLYKGADTNIKNQKSKTPLHLAALRGNRAWAQLFLSHGADVNIQDRRGWSALHYCVRYFHNKVLSTLLTHSHSVEVNIQDNDGETALCTAVNYSNIEATKLLLSYGADGNIKNCYGQTALETANRYGYNLQS